MIIKNFKVIAVLLLSFLIGVGSAYSGQSAASFKVDEVYTGIVKHEEDVKHLSPSFLWEYKNAKKVNFAGHYALFTFGRGGGALGIGILDAKTGKLVASEISNYLIDDFEGVKYSIDSSLLTIQGRTDEDDIVTLKSFAFKDGMLKLIKTESVSSVQ